MRFSHFALVSLAALSLAGCDATSQAQLTTMAADSAPVQKVATSTKGQLFCALDQGVAGQITVGLIDAAASSSGSSVAVLATNQTASFVQQACAAAAKATGSAAGVPVSPPSVAVPPVAITVPTPSAMLIPRCHVCCSGPSCAAEG